MNLKLLQVDGAGGGPAGIGANGLPFVPNVQQYSPERSTSTVQATPGYMQGIARGQQAYQDQIAGMQAEQQAAAKAAQAEVDIRQGYTPGAFEREDPFEAKRQLGQAAKDEQYWQERQRLRAEHAQAIQAAHQRFDERFQAATEASNYKSFWDDMDQYQRSNARLMILMGALGANKEHPNAGLEFLQARAKEDAERKAARAGRLIQLAETSKGALSDAYRARAEELSDFDLNYAAGMKILADQAALYAKTMIPQQLQAQAQQKVAQVQQEAAKAFQDAHEKLNARVENKDAHSTTTMGLGGQARPRSASDIQDFSIAQELDKKATRLDQLTEKGEVPTPEQIDAFANRTNAMVAAQIKESHGQGAILAGRLGRAFDALPKDAYPADMTPGQREWLKLHTEMVHQVGVKKFGQSAMSNPESYHEFVSPLLYSRGNTLEEGIEKGRAMSEQMHTTWENMRDLSGAGNIQQAKEAARTTQGQTASKPQQSAKAKTAGNPHEEAAVAWAKANRGNPTAEAVLKKAGIK